MFNKAAEATSKGKGTGAGGTLGVTAAATSAGSPSGRRARGALSQAEKARRAAEAAKPKVVRKAGRGTKRAAAGHAEGGVVGMAKGGNPFDMGKKSGKGVNPFAKGKPSKPKGKPPKKKGKNPFAFASGGSIDGVAKRGHTRAKGAK
jgi:hypothetical protein